MYLFRLVYYSRNIVKTLGQPVSSEIKSILNSAAKNNPSLGLTGALIFNDAYFAQVLEGDRKAVTATFCKIAGDPRHSDLVIMKAEPIEQRTFLRWSMAFAGHSDDIDPLYVKYGIAIGFNPALTDPIGTVVLSLENATAGASVDITDSRLRFVDPTNFFNQTSLQTLTFTEVPSAVIPLPATAWMVIGGLGLGALVARRRHGGADVVRSLRRERQQTPE